MQPPGSGSGYGPDADDDDDDFEDEPTRVHEIARPVRPTVERRKGLLREGLVVANKYELRELIAKGGMGTIWRARDQLLERPVAVKFMDRAIASDETLRERFVREARAAAKLRTMHVVQIYDFGIEEELPFIVMELLDGEDLHVTLKKQAPLPLEEAAWLIGEIAKGLQVAHDGAVVHRDLKPQNVFLATHANETIVKILDFGVAKMRGEFSGFQTAIGTVLGSPNYMSPEQARGRPDIDHRADLWSLAVIAFRAVTGKLAFPGDMAALVIVKICAEALPVPSKVLPGLPGPIDAFFERALQREPNDRFQSALELANAFNAAVRFAGAGPPRAIRSAHAAVNARRAPPKEQRTREPPSGGRTAAPTPSPQSGTPASGSPAPWAVPIGTPVPTPASLVSDAAPAETGSAPSAGSVRSGQTGPGMARTPLPSAPGQSATPAPTPRGLGPAERVAPPAPAGPQTPEPHAPKPLAQPPVLTPSSPLGLSSLSAGPSVPPPHGHARPAAARPASTIERESGAARRNASGSEPLPADATAQTRVDQLAASAKSALEPSTRSTDENDAEDATADTRQEQLVAQAARELKRGQSSDAGAERSEAGAGKPAPAVHGSAGPVDAPPARESKPGGVGLSSSADLAAGLAAAAPGAVAADLPSSPGASSPFDASDDDDDDGVDSDVRTVERRFPAERIAAAEAAIAAAKARTAADREPANAGALATEVAATAPSGPDPTLPWPLDDDMPPARRRLPVAALGGVAAGVVVLGIVGAMVVLGGPPPATGSPATPEPDVTAPNGPGDATTTESATDGGETTEADVDAGAPDTSATATGSADPDASATATESDEPPKRPRPKRTVPDWGY